jgi:hypothetical protein
MAIGYINQTGGAGKLGANETAILDLTVPAGIYLVWAKLSLALPLWNSPEPYEARFTLALTLGASGDLSFGHLVSAREFLNPTSAGPVAYATGSDSAVVAFNLGAIVNSPSNKISMTGIGTPGNLVMFGNAVISAIKLDLLNPSPGPFRIEIPEKIQRPPFPPKFVKVHETFLSRINDRLKKNSKRNPSR